MPPPIDVDSASDAESRATPASDMEVEETRLRGRKPVVEEPSEDDEDVEDADEGESEYIVESIKSHMFGEDGKLHFQVKWKGYERKSDMTWEPIENLEEGANDILQEYYESIGGKPQRKVAKRPRPETPQQGSAKSKRRTTSKKSTTPDIAGGKLTAQKLAGSWDGLIASVDTIENGDDGLLYVYLQWKDDLGGKRTRHPIEKVYDKCPRTMLHFYEQHLVFKEGGAKPETKVGNGLHDEDYD
ncbi:MAG: hypothetical protein M4579_002478 [Chaenotheca gracillima]|nr:MAG: hypothetical protein M4579_002478 [Chaenotheca gracillima]